MRVILILQCKGLLCMARRNSAYCNRQRWRRTFVSEGEYHRLFLPWLTIVWFQHAQEGCVLCILVLKCFDEVCLALSHDMELPAAIKIENEIHAAVRLFLCMSGTVPQHQEAWDLRICCCKLGNALFLVSCLKFASKCMLSWFQRVCGECGP